MLLRVTDGTTTATISPGGVSLGATYFPMAAASDEATTAESAVVVLEGSESGIRSALAGVERLLARARGLAPIWVEYRPTDSGDIWRSRVRKGRVQWSEAPGRRRLGAASNTVEATVLWERDNWWEGPEVELALSSSSQSERTGGVTIYNDDNAGVSTNWMQVAAAQAVGALPCPARVRLTNSAGTAVAWGNVYLGNNVFCDPANLDWCLLGSEAAGGASVSWTGSSTHSTLRYVWSLGSGLLGKTKGAVFHPVLGLTSVTSGVYVKLRIGSYVGAVFEAQRSSREIFLQYGEKLVDFGPMPVAPGGYDVATENMAFVLSVRYGGSGSMTVDALHLLATDGWRHLRQVAAYTIDDGDSFEDDGIDGGSWALDGVGGGRTAIVQGYGEPLLIWPGQLQRVHVLCDEGVGYTPGRAMVGRLWVRPRYRTVS